MSHIIIRVGEFKFNIVIILSHFFLWLAVGFVMHSPQPCQSEVATCSNLIHNIVNPDTLIQVNAMINMSNIVQAGSSQLAGEVFTDTSIKVSLVSYFSK